MVTLEQLLLSGWGQLFVVILILLITYLLVGIFKFSVNKALKKSTFFHINKTQFVVAKHFVSLFFYLIGIGLAIYIVPALRSLSVSLFAGAGILAIIIGFASQQAMSNIISGFFIIIFQPYKINDIIHVKNMDICVVTDINLRHTTMRTFENKHIIIPNSKMNEFEIENYNFEDSRIRRYIEFDISYDSDIDLAMHIMRDEIQKHPNCLDTRTPLEKENKEPKVPVRVIDFTDSSVKLRAWAWANSLSDAFVMHCDVRRSVKLRFDEEGVEIPFPYRTIVMKKDIKKNKKISAQLRKKYMSERATLNLRDR